LGQKILLGGVRIYSKIALFPWRGGGCCPMSFGENYEKGKNEKREERRKTIGTLKLKGLNKCNRGKTKSKWSTCGVNISILQKGEKSENIVLYGYADPLCNIL
jgi:hypothetical protein